MLLRFRYRMTQSLLRPFRTVLAQPLLFLLLALSSPAQQWPAPVRTEGSVAGPVSRILPPASFTAPLNQNLVYEVEWRLWTAGTATLSLATDGPLVRASATANSSGAVSVLYPVHDRFQSAFNPHTFCSQNLSKHTEEGFRSRETLIAFNYSRRRAVLDETNLKSGQGKHQEKDIPPCVTDVISGIFYIASLPLLLNTPSTFPLNDGGDTVDVTVTAEARETVTTPAGTYKTLRVSPQATSGPVKDKGQIWIWYTDDATRIPVQMRARMFWGTLTFRLLRVEKK